MASVWMVGFEEVPERSGEICVFEIFGDSASDDGTTYGVGAGIHPFSDPYLIDDFAAPRREIDVASWHVFGVGWAGEQVTFSIDGDPLRAMARSPAYPVQMMIGVFDFPERGGPDDHEPWLELDWVRGPSGRHRMSPKP